MHLKPLILNILLLWKEEGVRVCTHMNILTYMHCFFIAINDFPALSNLSGRSNNGYRACPHCLDETSTVGKLYPWARRFLLGKHPLKKKHDHYGGKEDHCTMPRHHCGKIVFEMVKDIEVVLGKGTASI